MAIIPRRTAAATTLPARVRDGSMKVRTPKSKKQKEVVANPCQAPALESIDALDLDAIGTHHTGLKVSLRWMILNVLSDTLRHLGHADARWSVAT